MIRVIAGALIILVIGIGAGVYYKIPDVDIWRAPQLMVKRFGATAAVEAAMRADRVLADGDPAGCSTWRRILDAIERLQATKPAEGDKVH